METMADRIEQLGGGGLPAPALHVFREHETRERALNDDRRISDGYRREELRALDDRTDTALREAQAKETAAALKDYEKRESAILGQIKGTSAVPNLSTETTSERDERRFRAASETQQLLADLIVVQASTDPADLADVFEEALEAGHEGRIRKLGAAVVAQLEALKRRKVAGASEAHAVAWSRYFAFKQKHPSLAAQLRAHRATKAGIEQGIARGYDRARSHFKLGIARHGIRM